MNQEAGEVVAGGILVEQLIVKRVRQPCDGMPVSQIPGSERPADRAAVQTLVDVRIFGDVAVVIVIDKGVTVGWVIEREGGYHQEQAQDDVTLFGRGEKT